MQALGVAQPGPGEVAAWGGSIHQPVRTPMGEDILASMRGNPVYLKTQ